MRRRKFIELTAITSTLVLAAGLFDIANSKPIDTSRQHSSNKDCHRMTGGRCSDYRMMENGPDSRFEREIFGV